MIWQRYAFVLLQVWTFVLHTQAKDAMFTSHHDRNPSGPMGTRSIMGGGCCCGAYTPMNFPNLNFEDGPQPAPGSFDTYAAGSQFGGWTVTRATIDLVDGTFAGLGNGNPNGASTFVDLHGSPGFGGISYLLTGLTPGNNYRIEFWTAQNGSGYSSTGTLLIAGGAWLNVSWTVSVSGASAWFKQVYEFMAMGTSANMEFSSTGGSNWGGTLVDDIVIFECPADQEDPVIVDEPQDEQYQCLNEVPRPPMIEVTDDCDPNPKVQFSTSTQKISDCEQIITRSWTVTDLCGNKRTHTQLISVRDEEPPFFVTPPSDRIIDCKNHSRSEFLRWVAQNGNAVLKDNCGTVFVQAFYDSIPSRSCDTLVVDFSARDDCGNETLYQASYIITEKSAPVIDPTPTDVWLRCSSSARDSLWRWLTLHGNAKASDDCSEVFWSHDFKGDSSALEIAVVFEATDRCGNRSTAKAYFRQSDGADTSYQRLYLCDRSPVRRDTLAYDLPGCDSVVIREMLGVGVDTTIVNLMSCDAGQVSKDYETLSTIYGCDSVIVRNYQYVKPDTSYQSVYDCQIPDTIQEYQIFADNPCDSVAVTIRIPARTSMSRALQFTCDSLAVRMDSVFSINQWGCDSVHVIETLYSGYRLSMRDTGVCGLQQEYLDTVVIATKDCDSLVVTRYLRLQEDSVQIVVPTCDPMQAGSFRFVYANRFGCDSVVWRQVVLQKTDTSAYQEYVCQKSEAGVDTLRIIRPNACDSILIRTKLYRAPDSTVIRNYTCDPLEAGTRTTLLRGQYCDSLVIEVKDLRPSYQTEEWRSTCHVDSVRTDTLKGLTQDGCDSTLVIRYKLDELDFEISSQDVLCAGNADGWISLKAEGGFAGPFWTEINGEWKNVVDLTGLSGGSYRIRMRDAAGCLSRDTLIHIGEPAVLTVDAGPDLEVNKDEPFILSATSSRQVSRWEWRPSDRFDCADCERPVGKFADSTEVVVKVTDANGCESEDRIWVFVRQNREVYVPNSFSPNGDGVNDRFYIYGDATAELRALRVYDRWGAEVFMLEGGRLNDPNAGWDGTFRGQALNPGVYVFYAEWLVSGRTAQLQGEITLVR